MHARRMHLLFLPFYSENLNDNFSFMRYNIGQIFAFLDNYILIKLINFVIL